MNRDDRLFAIIGVAVVTLAAALLLVSAGTLTIETATEEPAPTVVAPLPAVTTPTVSGVVQASLDVPRSDTGDDLVRRLVAGISAHPEWASWLVTDDLIRRFVAAVDAVADGYSPAAELDFAASRRPFLVREDEGRLVIAAGTYRRAERLVEVVSSVDADDLVTIYHELEPELAAAHREIAFHRGTFEQRMRDAVDHLLEVELPSGPVEVERRTLTYAFADERLESLSNAQRQLVRMGPANAGAIQDALRDIRAAFGWPEPEPKAGLQTVGAEGDAAAMAPLVVAAELGAEAESPTGSFGIAEPMLTPYDPRASRHDLVTAPRVMTSMP